MPEFDPRRFIVELLVESILYDDEYGLYSNVILVDRESLKEVYYAYYNPDDDLFTLERITDWEESTDEQDYLEASDGEPLHEFEDPESLASKIYDLAVAENLEPRVILGIEEEE